METGFAMEFTYIWIFFTLCCCCSSVQGSDGMVSTGKNDVYYADTSVAKYGEGKHFNVARNSTSRRLFGRHVCTQNKVVMLPVKDMQSYCKPTYQSYLRRCDKETARYCTGYRVVYELTYRAVQRFVPKTESLYTCCPGWTQTQVSSSDCKKALCRQECKNGGVCSKPDHCLCPTGWSGKSCETDVNECSRKRKPCEQECINVPGSFKCLCKEGFTLNPDGRSCERKDVSSNEVVKNDELLKKIESLQERLATLEEWRKTLKNGDAEDSRHPRDDRINSLSEQIAILEEKLEDCACNRRDIVSFPRPQK